MNWPSHPDDEWMDVTTYGSDHTEHLLVRSGVQSRIDKARAQYLADQITAEQFEREIDRTLEQTKPGYGDPLLPA